MYKRLCFMVLCICFFFNVVQVYAQNDVSQQQQVETYIESLSEIDAVTQQYMNDLSFSELVKNLWSGEISLSPESWKQEFFTLMFGEVQAQSKLIIQLLTVSVLAAVLRQLSHSLTAKEVGELGFYVCYMVLIVVILQTFFVLTSDVVERVEQGAEIFSVMLPVFLALSASSGNLTQVSIMAPTLMGGCTLIALFMKTVILPILLVAVALEMTDKLSDTPMTARFAKLLKQCISWGMKGLAAGFMLLLSLQKLTGGAINSLAVRTAKIAVNAIPVVGDVMGGAVDTAAAVSSTLRHGTLAGVILFFILFSLPILLKLVVMTLLFYFTAAATQSICEPRLVYCIGAAGEYTALLLGAIFLIQVMLLFAVVLLLGVV